jgi:hypothetical protein
MRLARPAPSVGLLLLLLLALLGPVMAGPARAQSFGKNKVQYEALDWSVFETAHLRLHHYAEEDSLARRLAAYAESVCVEYDARFRVKPRSKVPFLLYSAHSLFQQSNAAMGLISEGTGGLTELVKGRVLVPHTGSWSRLAWVTRHELAHWYMLEKLARVMKDHHRMQTSLPPLWFVEGLAEYFGTSWDADAEGLLRDAVLSGEALPLRHSEPIWGSVLMYKEGQSFMLWYTARWGEDRLIALLEDWWRADEFETVFRITTGERFETADEAWFATLRARWYPAVATLDRVGDVARRRTPRGRYNLGGRALPLPAAWDTMPAAARDTALSLCWFAASESGIELRVSEPAPDGRRREHRLLRGYQSPRFESFHLFQNRPGVSASGRVVLSSKRGARECLHVVDVARRRIERTVDLPGLVMVTDPVFAPGESTLVFSAQDASGRADLYRLAWRAPERLERLTDDDFDDIEPTVSPDGRWVAFASDRGERGGRYSLFRLALEDGHVETLSAPVAGDDRQPVYSPDGRWLAFRSTRGGTSDLWVRDAAPARAARRVTRLRGVATDPDWLPGGRGLLFTAQEGVRFQVCSLPVAPESLAAEPESLAAPRPALPPLAFADPPRRYQRRVGLDLVQNAVAYDPVLGGAIGAGQISLSDVLGNEQYYVFLANDSERFGDFWDGFQVGVTYVNQARRLNYGLGAFRLTEQYDADLDLIRREKRVGLLALASYPFDKFTRLEASVVVRHAGEHLLRDGRVLDVDLVSDFLTLVRDNVGWSSLGPASGMRAYLSAGFTRDLTSGAADFGTLMAEERHYLNPFPGLVLASRAQGLASLGADAQRYYLGGRSTLRGWERRSLAGTRTVLLQQEARFPVLRGLVLAVPAPWEFPAVTGAGFVDAAWAWDEQSMDRRGSVGFAVYLGGAYFPAVRWNFAWTTTDWAHWAKRPATQFNLGFNF